MTSPPRTRPAAAVARGVGRTWRTLQSTAFSSLTEPLFRRWFATQLLSASGNLTQGLAIAWLVLQSGGGAVHLGYVSALGMIPSLVGGAFAGSIVDRVDRRRLLIVTQILLAAIGIGLFVLTRTGHTTMPVLYAAAVATGLVAAFDAPARQVYVLDIVGTQRLASAVSLYEIVMNGSRVIGPAVGGALLAFLGAAPCFLGNALTYLPPLIVLLRDRHSRATMREHDELKPSARSGLRYAFATPSIRACLLFAVLGGILFNPSVLPPALAANSYHLGAGGLGALLAFFGLGALPGALLAATRGLPSGRLVGWLAVATGVAMMVTVATGFAIAAFVGMVLTGFVSIWFIAATNTFVQVRADPQMRGRVMGVWTMALPGMSPLTGIATGWLADRFDARIAFAVGGLLLLIAGLVTRRGLSAERPWGSTPGLTAGDA